MIFNITEFLEKWKQAYITDPENIRKCKLEKVPIISKSNCLVKNIKYIFNTQFYKYKGQYQDELAPIFINYVIEFLEPNIIYSERKFSIRNVYPKMGINFTRTRIGQICLNKIIKEDFKLSDRLNEYFGG